MKTHIVQQNISYDKKSVDMLIFEFQGNGRDLAMMRINYKLTKTKIEIFQKFLKLYIIIKFNYIRCKLTASGKIFNSILNYNLMRPVSLLRQPKE